jgi:hypothetical protein
MRAPRTRARSTPAPAGGLLRPRGHLAARRRRLRWLRRAHPEGPGAPRRPRAGRLDRHGRTQVAVPAVRGGMPDGQGRGEAGGRVQGGARVPAGHAVGTRASQLQRQGAAADPPVPGAQGLDVHPDVRPGRVSACRREGDGPRRARRGLRARIGLPRDRQSGFPGGRLLPVPPARSELGAGPARGAQQAGAGQGDRHGHGVHVVHAAARELLTPLLHPEPPDHLAGRAGDTPGDRALRP